jgi:Sulfotransferase family
MDPARFDRDVLTEAAIRATGLDDFGEPTWQDGLDRLLADFVAEARLHELGVEIALGDVADYLAIRLGLTGYAREHPELAEAPITRPIVIIGQPRTGTTILYDLLAQDPQLRAPLTWEVDEPVPPPDPATADTDPRIAEVQARLEMADSLIPGFTDFHPMGAMLAQECVRITASDFRSMIFNTQYRVPEYSRWLLYEADMAPGYRWHRRYLEHLQARLPPQQWLLKSPAHMWHLGALVGEYPDVTVIQTHRDPLKVVASVSALMAHLRQMASDEGSVAQSAGDMVDDVFVGLDRSIDARDDGTLAAEHVVDVQFTDFMADPFETIGRIYDQLGLVLTAATDNRMRAFLEAHPGDGGGGGGRYRFADTELDAAELRERARPYQERFDVPSEPVT